MNELLVRAERAKERAWQIIREVELFEVWQSVGATVNLVGSVRNGLLMDSGDIDVHVYTDPFRLEDSFLAIARLAAHKGIARISYGNLIDTDEKCVEWHASYEPGDGGRPWQIDMIHILPDSQYVGVFEGVADKVSAALTPETRQAILAIKAAVPDGQKVPGIQIYKAVIQDGVRTFAEFTQWQSCHDCSGIVLWD
jgi:hypothetical protein